MQEQNDSKQHTSNKRGLWIVIAITSLVIIPGLVIVVLLHFSERFCVWDGSISSWVDENGNGKWDKGEPPLEGVQFHVNNTKRGLKDIGSRTTSDWNGHADVNVDLIGCPSARFEVYAVPPIGYRFVTNEVVQVEGPGYGNGDSIQFGFARIPGYPTPTPYVSNLTCRSYPQSAFEISSAPDGTIWMVNIFGAVRFDPQTDTWQTYPVSTTVTAIFDQIQVGNNRTVWITDFENTSARLQGSSWIYFTGEKSLVAASEQSIGRTPDGEIWFAPQAPPDILVAFNPKNNSWKAYYGSAGAHGDSTSARIFTDGTVWRLAFGYRSAYDPPEPVPAGWKIYDRHIFSSAEIQTIPFDGWIKSVKIDPDGILWIAHTGGISRFNPVSNDWYLYDLPSTDGALSEEPEDLAISNSGSLWVASGYVHSMAFQFTPTSSDYKSGAWHMYDPRDGIPDYTRIDNIAIDKDGAVWFGFGFEQTVARCFSKIAP